MLSIRPIDGLRDGRKELNTSTSLQERQQLEKETKSSDDGIKAMQIPLSPP